MYFLLGGGGNRQIEALTDRFSCQRRYVCLLTTPSLVSSIITKQTSNRFSPISNDIL